MNCGRNISCARRRTTRGILIGIIRCAVCCIVIEAFRRYGEEVWRLSGSFTVAVRFDVCPRRTFGVPTCLDLLIAASRQAAHGYVARALRAPLAAPSRAHACVAAHLPTAESRENAHARRSGLLLRR